MWPHECMCNITVYNDYYHLYLFVMMLWCMYLLWKSQSSHLTICNGFVVVFAAIIRFTLHSKWPVTTGALDKHIHVMKTLHWNKLVSVRSCKVELLLLLSTLFQFHWRIYNNNIIWITDSVASMVLVFIFPQTKWPDNYSKRSQTNKRT